MLSRLLLLGSVLCCGLVLVSFGLFAYDEASGASNGQVASLNGQGSRTGSPVPIRVAQPRRFIDGAAHTLTSPFRSLVNGDSQWAVWLVSTGLALLVYGVGVGFLSRVVRLSHSGA